MIKRFKQYVSVVLVAALAADPLHAASLTQSLQSHSPISQLPSKLGFVTDRYFPASSTKPLVVLIQDVHGNFNVQRQIAEILKRLNRRDHLRTVFVEGAKGPFDVSLLRRVRDEWVKKEVVGRFLKEMKLNGSEAAAVESDEPLHLWGIDDPALYLRNINSFSQALRKSPAPHLKNPVWRTYYAIAKDRNVPMALHTIQHLDLLARTQASPRLVGLVVGGFHTEGISQILKANHIPYLVVTPNVSAMEDLHPYSDYLRTIVETTRRNQLAPPALLAVGGIVTSFVAYQQGVLQQIIHEIMTLTPQSPLTFVALVIAVLAMAYFRIPFLGIAATVVLDGNHGIDGRLVDLGYSASEIAFLRTNPTLTLEGKPTTLFPELDGKTTDEQIELITTYFPPFHSNNPELSPSVSFDEYRELQAQYARGDISLSNNIISKERLSPADVNVVDFSAANKRFLILGPPGAGNGRYGTELAERLGVPLISVGKLMREAAKDPTFPFQEQVQQALTDVDFNPHWMELLLSQRLQQPDVQNGYVLEARPSVVAFPFRVLDMEPTRVILLEGSKKTVRRLWQERRARGKTYTASAFDERHDSFASLLPQVRDEFEHRGMLSIVSLEDSRGRRRQPEEVMNDIYQVASPLEQFQGVRLQGTTPEQAKAWGKSGDAAIAGGQVAKVIQVAGTAERFFSKNVPEFMRIKGLAEVARIGGQAVSILELMVRHALQYSAALGNSITQIICTMAAQRPYLTEVIEKRGRFGLHQDDYGMYQVNLVPRLNPHRADLVATLKNEGDADKMLSANGEPGDYFRLQSGEPSLKNISHFDTMVNLVLSRDLLSLAQRGVKVIAIPNGEDLGGVIDPVRIGLFLESDAEMMTTVSKPDSIFVVHSPVFGRDTKSRPKTFRIIIRNGTVIFPRRDVPEIAKGDDVLPEDFEPILVNGKLEGVKAVASGEPIKCEIKEEPDRGGALVSVDGRPRILEGIAFPSDYPRMGLLLNTNQLLFKTDALLALFGLSIEEYRRIRQEDLLKKVEAVGRRMQTYVEIKDFRVNPIDPADTRERTAAQFSRLIGDMTSLLKTQYVIVDRDNRDGRGGFFPTKNPEDIILSRPQIDRLLASAGFEQDPRVQVTDKTEGVIFNDGFVLIGGERKSISDLSFDDYQKVMNLILSNRLQSSRFRRTHEYVFLPLAVYDFMGKGIPAELEQEEFEQRRQRALNAYLKWIYWSPSRAAFLQYLWNYPVVVTARNVNTPIYVAIANYLAGRPLGDRTFVEENADVFAGNLTIESHPWYGSGEVAKLPLTVEQSPQLEQPKKKRLRILFFAEGERGGPNRKLDYFKQILNRFPPGTIAESEINVYDIHYPSEIHVFDQSGHFLRKEKAFPFGTDNQYYDAQNGTHFRKLDLRNARDDIASAEYRADALFDIVVNSRMAVWYNNQPEKKHNLLRNLLSHVAENGVLFYDTSDADRLEVYVKNSAGQTRRAGFVPYEDKRNADINRGKLMQRFASLSPAQQKMLEDSYRLASKYISAGSYLFSKQILAKMVAAFTQDPVMAAAFLMQTVPDEAIREILSADVVESVLERKKTLGPMFLNHDFFDAQYYTHLQSFDRAERLRIGAAAPGALTGTVHIFEDISFRLTKGMRGDQEVLRFTEMNPKTGQVISQSDASIVNPGPSGAPAAASKRRHSMTFVQLILSFLSLAMNPMGALAAIGLHEAGHVLMYILLYPAAVVMALVQGKKIPTFLPIRDMYFNSTYGIGFDIPSLGSPVLDQMVEAGGIVATAMAATFMWASPQWHATAVASLIVTIIGLLPLPNSDAGKLFGVPAYFESLAAAA